MTEALQMPIELPGEEVGVRRSFRRAGGACLAASRQLGDAGLLLSRGLLHADRDDHAMGRPLVYQPTPRMLQLLDAETLEEARARLGVPAGYPSLVDPTPGTEVPVRYEAGSTGAAV